MSWVLYFRNIVKEVWKFRFLMVYKNKVEIFYWLIYWDIILLILYFFFFFLVMCVVLIFINDFYGLFKIYFFFKKDGYFVSGLEF